MILHDLVTTHKSRSDTFRLYPIGDIHLGAAACDVDALRKTLSEIEQDDSALWVGMGDFAECINLQDKRFDVKSVDPKYLPRLDDIANACFEDLAEMFAPIRDKCIGLLVGNHEETLRLKHSQDVHGALCLRLGLKNLGYDSLIRWKFVRQVSGGKAPATNLTIFASHGTIAGRRDGAKLNRIEDLNRNFDADMYLVGHGHSQLVGRSVQLTVPESGKLKMKERLRLSLMTGCWRKSYEEGTRDYSEKSHFAPPVIGCPVVTIRPWADPRQRMSVSL